VAELDVVTDMERVGRRAAIATFALAMGLVAVFLVWIVDLVILLATGQSNQVQGGPDLPAWKEAKGLMPIVIPWWLYFVLVAGWAIVLAMVWSGVVYFERWGRHAVLFASPSAVGALALPTGLATLSSGVYFEPEGLGWYPVPGVLLIGIALVAFGREIAIRRAYQRQLRRRRAAAAARRRARKERA
jgi:hypothetical protein